MSSLEANVNKKLLNIENSLVDVLDLVDYKQLCEDQLGYNLDPENINEFITKYTKKLEKLYEIRNEQDNDLVNGTLIMFTSFILAIFSLMFTQVPYVFIGILIIGFIIHRVLKARIKSKCKQDKDQLKSEWKEYRSTLPYNSKVISIMEDIVYDYGGEFKYPSDFYKELYLRLKNNSMIK